MESWHCTKAPLGRWGNRLARHAGQKLVLVGRGDATGGPGLGGAAGQGDLSQGWALLTVSCFCPFRFIPQITLAITSHQTPLHRLAPLRGLQVGEKWCSLSEG